MAVPFDRTDAGLEELAIFLLALVSRGACWKIEENNERVLLVTVTGC